MLKVFNKKNKKFFMNRESFSKFCKKTKLDPYSDKIFVLFSKGTPEQLSIYELLSGIILFSSLTWEQKVSLGFSLFDFDNDSSLNKDELQMLLCMYKNSIQTITNFRVDLSGISSQINESENEKIHRNE